MAKIDDILMKPWIISDPARRILRDPDIWESLNQRQKTQIFKNEIDAAIEIAETSIKQAKISIKEAETTIKQQQRNVENLKMAQTMIKEKM